MDILEDLQREWQEHKPGHARPLVGQLAAAAARTQSPDSSQPEVQPVSVGTALHRIAAVAEKIGDDADAVLVAITDHPEGVEVLRAVAAAMGVPLPVGAITAGATAFKIAVTAFEAGKNAAAQQAAQQGQQATFTPAAGNGTGAQPALAQQ